MSSYCIFSSCLLHQHELHSSFGGIVPGLALKAHKERIDTVVADAITQANLSGVEYVVMNFVFHNL